MIKKLVSNILHLLPLRRIILFESAPPFSDNTYALYQYFLENNYQKKYKFVWIVTEDNKKFQFPKGTRVIYVKQKIRRILLMNTAKCLISCNRYLEKQRPEQLSIYLMHGTPVKSIRGYKNNTLEKSVDYMIAASNQVVGISSYEWKFPTQRTIGLGYPRNDIFLQPRLDLDKYFGKHKKYIIWYPTVRQFIYGKKTASSYALPIIHDSSAAQRINDVAKQNDVLIVMKPHFAQDTSFVRQMELSNLIFIDDSFFFKNRILSYQFVGSFDALLTDYSSIYYDFMLCDKPIGLILEDIEEYKKDPGLVKDYQRLMAGGVSIYNGEELCDFIYSISEGIDELKEIRNDLCDEVNYSRDGRSSERVAKFVLEKLGEQI